MRRHPTHPVVSVVFDSRAPLAGAIAELMEQGIARDQIEIVTDPDTARRESLARLEKATKTAAGAPLYSAAIRPDSCAASHFSASSAAMQPRPAAVTAWR